MAVPPVFVSGQVLTAAQMNQIGLWEVVTETAFSASSSIVANNCYTSDFTNYQIIINYTSTTTGEIGYKNRVGGVSASTNYNFQKTDFYATTSAIARSSSSTFFRIGAGTNGSFNSAIIVNVLKPQLAEATAIMAFNDAVVGVATDPGVYNTFGNHSTATAYDGFEIYPLSGTMTGSYTVYGLRK